MSGICVCQDEYVKLVYSYFSDFRHLGELKETGWLISKPCPICSVELRSIQSFDPDREGPYVFSHYIGDWWGQECPPEGV